MSLSAQEAASSHLNRTYIHGCHILHYSGVVDAYGHLSVRSPSDPSHFMMSRYIAPGTISSPMDLVEYNVSDASPVDPSSPNGYSERCIHSEIYKRFPEVHSVIHSHSEAVVPYSISGVSLRPCYHMAGFLGKEKSSSTENIGTNSQATRRQCLILISTTDRVMCMIFSSRTLIWVQR
jgi:ribulose-5-phosphate 4-epimerase/fuculose-1-phosphate aldolase